MPGIRLQRPALSLRALCKGESERLQCVNLSSSESKERDGRKLCRTVYACAGVTAMLRAKSVRVAKQTLPVGTQSVSANALCFESEMRGRKGSKLLRSVFVWKGGVDFYSASGRLLFGEGQTGPASSRQYWRKDSEIDRLSRRYDGRCTVRSRGGGGGTRRLRGGRISKSGRTEAGRDGGGCR